MGELLPVVARIAQPIPQRHTRRIRSWTTLEGHRSHRHVAGRLEMHVRDVSSRKNRGEGVVQYNKLKIVNYKEEDEDGENVQLVRLIGMMV